MSFRGAVFLTQLIAGVVSALVVLMTWTDLELADRFGSSSCHRTTAGCLFRRGNTVKVWSRNIAAA